MQAIAAKAGEYARIAGVNYIKITPRHDRIKEKKYNVHINDLPQLRRVSSNWI